MSLPQESTAPRAPQDGGGAVNMVGRLQTGPSHFFKVIDLGLGLVPSTHSPALH